MASQEPCDGNEMAAIREVMPILILMLLALEQAGVDLEPRCYSAFEGSEKVRNRNQIKAVASPGNPTSGFCGGHRFVTLDLKRIRTIVTSS